MIGIRALCGLFLLALSACSPAEAGQFQVQMLTQSDDGVPLGEVSVWHDNKLLGTSSAVGKLIATVEAAADSDFLIRVECPSRYQAVRKRVLVPLRRVESASRKLSVVLECKPDTRNALLVVNSNLANIPLLRGEKIIGITDKGGIAHVSLDMKEGETFEVVLDTSGDPRVRPPSPSYAFVMPAHDEAFTVSEKFKVHIPRKRKRRRRKPVKIEKPRGPTQVFGNTGQQWGRVQ